MSIPQHCAISTSRSARFHCVKLASNHPRKPPAHVLTAHAQHNEPITFFVHVQIFFFFPFPPNFVCSTIHPWPPMRFPVHLTSRIQSTNAVASLDELRGPHLPPNHATTATPIALSLLPLPCHPCMPLYMPALKPCTRTTHEACRGPHFCGGSNW